jgi:Peptidase family M28
MAVPPRVVRAGLLETIGFYSDEEGSQRYPWPLGLLYPGRGDFVAFVGLVSSRAFVRRAVAAFRALAAFPSQGGTAPGLIPGIDWSDHWSFAQAGIPALMVTDTALFRYPHYHSPADTPDKVDYERLARVVSGLERVVRAWARDRAGEALIRHPDLLQEANPLPKAGSSSGAQAMSTRTQEAGPCWRDAP